MTTLANLLSSNRLDAVRLANTDERFESELAVLVLRPNHRRARHTPLAPHAARSLGSVFAPPASSTRPPGPRQTAICP